MNPDPGAAERFQELQHAHDVPSDPEARARYDASRARPTRQGTWPSRAGAQQVWLGGPSFSRALGDAGLAHGPSNSAFLGSRTAYLHFRINVHEP